MGREKPKKEDRRPRLPAEERGSLRTNLWFLFKTNFKFILPFFPSMACLYLFLTLGGAVFLAAAMALLCLAGPSCAAMFDMGYAVARGTPRFERRGFLASCRLNARQGAATMALIGLLLFPIALCAAAATSGAPAWVYVFLFMGAAYVLAFSIAAFSQIALVDLPLRKIWKNAMLLPPLLGWRGIKVVAVNGLFLVVLYQWIAYTFLAFLLLFPALLTAWSCRTLLPRLEEILIDEAE